MKICIIGAGYVGLVSAACFAEFGFTVTCVDKDTGRIARLKARRGADLRARPRRAVARNTEAGRLHFSTSLAEAVSQAELVFLAVGTPMRRGDGYADLTYIFEAVEEAAPHLGASAVIATKSTVPVGTSRDIEGRLRELRPDLDVVVCSNPEFLREGSAIYDFTHPDRVLIGCEEGRGREVMQRLYKPLALRNAPIVFCSPELAELAKYAANAFLAMKVTFINEVADLCEAVGADVQEVATAIGADGRIGGKFLHAGPGYGGSCFPKDVTALIRTAREAKAPLSLVEQVEKVNTERKIAMAGRIEAAIGGSVRRQDGWRARRNLQAQYRRYARGAVPRDLSHAAGTGRAYSRLRSARLRQGARPASGRGVVRQRARGRRGRRYSRGVDRVERVSRARFEADAPSHARQCAGRLAQYVSRGIGGGGWVRLFRYRPDAAAAYEPGAQETSEFRGQGQGYRPSHPLELGG